MNQGDKLAPGDVLAKIPREMSKTKDITGGLPRVDFFEARKPKDPAVVSEIDGTIVITEPVRGQRRIMVEGEGDEQREYSIPGATPTSRSRRPSSSRPATPSPRVRSTRRHSVILGEKEMQRHLVDKIQRVYRSQGVTINDKHLKSWFAR